MAELYQRPSHLPNTDSSRCDYIFRQFFPLQNLWYNQDSYELQNIDFINPLIIQEGKTYLVQTVIHPFENGQSRFEINSREKLKMMRG